MSSKKCQDDNNSFGGRLRLFRKSKGLSVLSFSELLDISHPSLSQTENNKTTTSAQTISNLVQNTNINIYWLCTGEGEMIRGDEKGSIYNKVEDEDPEVADLLSRTMEILKSGTDYSVSLAANIRSFHHAIKTENRLDVLEAEIKSVKSGIKKSNQIREEDPPGEKERFLKKRVM